MEAQKKQLAKPAKVKSTASKPDQPATAQKPVKPVNTGFIVKTGDILLNRYMLMREIGRGGTSRVYRARDLLAVLSGDLSESDIAVKVVNLPDKIDGKQNSQLSMHEALTTRHLSHPNLIKIFDYHKHKDVVFVTMELADGNSLAQLSEKHPEGILPYNKLVSVLNKVVKGITYAHKHGVVHSDIKPSNILLTSKSEVKIIDFATARSIQPKDGAKKQRNFGFYGFTEAYSSPRVVRDEYPCVGDDIYSVACVIYELLAGQKLYPNKNNSITTHISRKVGANVTGAVNPQQPKEIRASKPKHINWLQWQLLKSAASEKGSVKFGSIKQFWNLFKLSRYFYHAVATVLLLVLAIAGTTKLYSDWSEPPTNLEAPLQLSLAAQLEGLNKLPLDSQLLFVEQVTQSTTALPNETIPSQFVPQDLTEEQLKLLMRDSVIDQLQIEFEELLAYDTSDFSTPPFQEAEKLINRALTVYPDSAQLQINLKRIASDKEQYIDYLILEHDRLWILNQHDIETANKINRILLSLSQLGYEHAHLANEQYINDVSIAMRLAITEEDFLQYYQLHSFLELLTELALARIAINHFDEAYMASARALINYNPSEQQFPNQAASLWSEIQLSNINEKVLASQSAQDLLDVHSEYDLLLNKLHADYSNTFAMPITQLLFDQYSNLLSTNNELELNIRLSIEDQRENLAFYLDEQ